MACTNLIETFFGFQAEQTNFQQLGTATAAAVSQNNNNNPK
jgi:hypothetical protein